MDNKKNEKLNNLKKRLEKRRLERIEDNNNNNSSSSGENQKLLADLMEMDKREIEEMARVEEEAFVETQERRQKILDIVKDQYSIYSTRIDEDMKFRKENSKKLLKERSDIYIYIYIYVCVCVCVCM